MACQTIKDSLFQLSIFVADTASDTFSNSLHGLIASSNAMCLRNTISEELEVFVADTISDTFGLIASSKAMVYYGLSLSFNFQFCEYIYQFKS